MANKPFSGEIDPEIAKLVGIKADVPSVPASRKPEPVPDFNALFSESKTESAPLEAIAASIVQDVGRTAFEPIKAFEERPKPLFTAQDYYKKALVDEGEPAHRFHNLFMKFLSCKDPQERSIYRQKLIPAYWELSSSIAAGAHTALATEKRLLLRFGIVLPTLLSPEQRDSISRIISENTTGEPLYYVDEWLRAVAEGSVTPSAVDETKQPSGQASQNKINAVLEKQRGRYEAQIALIRTKLSELESLEAHLQERAQAVSRHATREEYGNLKAPMTALQRQALSEINEIIRRIGTLDRELTRFYAELDEISKHYRDAKEKSARGVTADIDPKTAVKELQTVRQMAKLCVGRQGNHFPVLMKQYFRPELRDIGTRENVISIMAEVERLDPGLFFRTFKQQTQRIVPNVVLVPCYGDKGICWEPFERFNRASSRGRIAIPIFPKDLKPAVITALADLRWQVAKEKAQHYWMEEGLTGWYFQWFTERKLKGDVREYFIQDYLLWITKESEGTQKLDRDVRDIFWRYIPFPQELKDSLKNRGFVYAELCNTERRSRRDPKASGNAAHSGPIESGEIRSRYTSTISSRYDSGASM
jgi:hypothetical protein